MIEACIFDIGGTLIRTEEALLGAIKETLLGNGLNPPPDEDIFIHFGIGHRNIFSKIISKTCEKEDIAPLIEKCYGSFVKKYPYEFLDKFQLMPEAENCLAELRQRGIKLACQTGMMRSEARILLEHFGILEYFPVLVAFEDADKSRPYPNAMYLTLKRLDISDNRCLYIGDTINDIRFAKNAGVKIACVTTGPQKREMLEKEKPDCIINNLTDLLDLV